CNASNSEILSNLDKYLEHLPNHKRSDVCSVLHDYPQVTADEPGHCTHTLHDVQLADPEVRPIKQSCYRVSPEKKKILKSEVDYLLDHGLAEPSNSPWASPSLLVPKPGGSNRLCTDYRKVNQITVPDSYPLPLIDDLIDSVGQAKFITKIDLQKGYYQIGLTDNAKSISAFITPFVLFQYTVMPFGMINAPATFQGAINYTIQGLEGINSYLDDLLVISDTWEAHVERLKSLFGFLSDAGFTINLAKSTFCSANVTYLGHIVGHGKTKPKEVNVEAISSYPVPQSRRSLMRFLGMAGLYRRFCSNFATIAKPLTDLTSVKRQFKWTSECQDSYEQLKLLITSKPVLRNPDHSQPFVLQIDASSYGVGAVLMQEDLHSNLLHPVAYFSAKLKKHQQSYSTIEKEALSLILALRKFDCYLHSLHPVTVYTDHNPLVFIQRMKNSNQRILRWALQIQQYNLTMKHIKGVDNIMRSGYQ
ncbi:MAG: reverse transcriptase family protein, partial [Bacteroidota bacterium]